MDDGDRPGLGAPVHWLSVQVQDLVENQHVIQVDSEATIDEACDSLIEHNVQSVPLYDSRNQSYVGMFDLHDLATYIFMKRRRSHQQMMLGAKPEQGEEKEKEEEKEDGRPLLSPQSPVVGGSGSGTSSPLARRATLSARRNSLEGGGSAAEHVGRVADLSRTNPFYAVVPEATVAQVGAVFAKGAHRVAVMQAERTIRGILSQARVVKYFFEHSGNTIQGSPTSSLQPHHAAAPAAGARRVWVAPEESAILDKSLRELGLVTNDVVVAHPSTPVIQALSLLERWHISSIAIVEEPSGTKNTQTPGRLVGNLSVSDIKYLARDKTLVGGSCIELIQKVRFLQGLHDGQDRAAVFSVRPEATLRYALSKLIATGAHRVWITEPAAQQEMQPPLSAAASSSSAAAAGGGSCAPSEADSARGRRASVSSASSQTVAIAPAYFAGAFGDAVCGVMSLTDVLRLLMENAPHTHRPPARNPEYNYASMD
ncbi:cell separation during budding [Coemansia sp. Benny D160-2]|nr:cell separation during budding [Coemansia sp. Benny D160-2]